MDKKRLIEKTNRYIFPSYKRSPVVIAEGKGCTVWDVNGKEYLDFVSGIAVNNLGHRHPAVLKAIREQMQLNWQNS
jgi:acetylornithine/succinyldiaminopimelate/putrescine aminotransferase